jgi:hypothetical protein
MPWMGLDGCQWGQDGCASMAFLDGYGSCPVLRSASLAMLREASSLLMSPAQIARGPCPGHVCNAVCELEPYMRPWPCVGRHVSAVCRQTVGRQRYVDRYHIYCHAICGPGSGMWGIVCGTCASRLVRYVAACRQTSTKNPGFPEKKSVLLCRLASYHPLTLCSSFNLAASRRGRS